MAPFLIFLFLSMLFKMCESTDHWDKWYTRLTNKHTLLWAITILFRNSRPDVFCKKGILRNFAKLSGKRLCQSLYFNKVAGLRPANLLKQRLWRRCFLENFAKFLRTPFLIEHLWWLLLSYGHSSNRCILTRNNFITLIVLLWSPLALR